MRPDPQQKKLDLIHFFISQDVFGELSYDARTEYMVLRGPGGRLARAFTMAQLLPTGYRTQSFDGLFASRASVVSTPKLT